MLPFDLEADYIRPDFALEAMEETRLQLPGRGYLYLTAPGGTGKSVLVQALRERWQEGPTASEKGRTVAYAVLHGRPENTANFLKDVHNQAVNMVRKRPLHINVDLQSCNTLPDVQRALLTILHTAKKHRCSDQPLILAVDGIDELRDRSSGGGLLIVETLPTPEQLPEGCYVLLTSRPELRPTVQKALKKRLGETNDCLKEIRMSGAEPGYLNLLRDYLLRGLGEVVREHLPTLLEKSQGSFLYVRFLRDLLRFRQDDLVQLRPGDLPAGEDIFPAYLEKLSGRVKGGSDVFRQRHQPVLMLIAAAFEPISRAHLKTWLKPGVWDTDADYQLDQTLTELSPLLREDRHSLPADSLYGIGHQDLLTWLQRPEGEWQTALRSLGHQCIAERGRDSRPAHPGSYGLSRSAPDYYHLLHLPSHCLVLGDFAAAREVLGESEWRSLTDEVSGTLNRKCLWADSIELWERQADQYELLVINLGGDESAAADNPALVNDLAGAHMNRSVALDSQQRFDKALEAYQRAIDLREQLMRNLGGDESAAANHPALVNDLAGAHMNRGVALRQQQRFDDALEAYQRAIELMEQLVSVLQHYILGALLTALRNRQILHSRRNDADGWWTGLVLAVNWTLHVYRTVGRKIDLPNVREQFHWFDQFVELVPAQAEELPEDWQSQWAEIRALFGLD